LSGSASGAEDVRTADDVDLCRDERGFAEGDGETNAPWSQTDVLNAKMTVGVLTNAEEAEEGQQRSAPVTTTFEGRVIEVWVEGDSDILMAVVVAETGHQLIETKTTREEAVMMVQGVVGKSSDEARNGCDFVTPRREGGHNETEAILGEWERGVDAEFGA
jgi:hypothetical protein